MPRPAGLVTRANGVDPAQPARVLRLPEPKVLVKIKQAWRADRKPANVMIVFDNSGSMGEENKLEQAVEGLKGFFREAAPQDRIGLIKFSGQITPLVPIAPMRTNRDALLAAADEIFPEDETRVRDATIAGVQAVEAALDPDAINAVVVLTDGEDTSSGRTRRSGRPRARGPATQGVRPDPGLHHRLRVRAQRRRARRLREGQRRQQLRGRRRGHRVDLPVDQLLLLMNRPPTRGELQLALALNAATKPLNVAVPTGVTLAAPLPGDAVASAARVRVLAGAGRHRPSSTSARRPPSVRASAPPGVPPLRACRRSSRRWRGAGTRRSRPARRSGATARARSC